MLLSGIMLKNVNSVNYFQPANQISIFLGNPTNLYLQLIDTDQTDVNGETMRYMPVSGATLTITIDNIGGVNNLINRPANNPYAQDTSIWTVPILSTDVLRSGYLTGTLTEGGTVRNFRNSKCS